MKKCLTAIVASLFVGASVLGETNQTARLVGTWVAVADRNRAYPNETESIYYAFRTEGTVLIWATVPLVKGTHFEGQYEIITGSVIRLNFPSQGSREFALELTGSTMTMNDRVETNSWIRCKKIADRDREPHR